MTIHFQARGGTRGIQSRGALDGAADEASGALGTADPCTILGPSNAGGGRCATIGLEG